MRLHDSKSKWGRERSGDLLITVNLVKSADLVHVLAALRSGAMSTYMYLCAIGSITNPGPQSSAFGQSYHVCIIRSLKKSGGGWRSFASFFSLLELSLNMDRKGRLKLKKRVRGLIFASLYALHASSQKPLTTSKRWQKYKEKRILV